MVAVSEADKVPPACDGNLVGHLCSFCLLRRDRTLRPIEVLYEAVLGATCDGRVRATKFEIARFISELETSKGGSDIIDCLRRAHRAALRLEPILYGSE
jgi:hypothetical protein